MTLTNAKTHARKIFSLFIFAITASTSVHATELVKVEKLNKIELSTNTAVNLSESIQLMKISLNSTQNTAKTILSEHISNLDNKSDNPLAKVTLLAD